MLTLGTAKLTVPGGKQLKLTLKLGAKGKALLAQKKVLKVAIATKVTDAAGNVATKTANVTVKLKPRAKK